MISSTKSPAPVSAPQAAVARASLAIGADVRPALILALLQGPLRTSALARLVPGASARQIGRGLKALERDGFVLRTIYAEAPPRVDYRLTAIGRVLGPLAAALADCGEALGRVCAGNGTSHL